MKARESEPGRHGCLGVRLTDKRPFERKGWQNKWLPKGATFPNPPTIEGRVQKLPSGQWASKGDAYAMFVSRMKSSRPHGFRAVLWHQGESDAIEGQQANYETNLTNFISDVRSNYGTDLPFMIGEIRRQSTATNTVADAQVAVGAADPNATFVQAADLSFLDTYHFDAASMITLGERYANSYALNYGSNIPEPSSLALLSLAGLLVTRRRRS